MIKKFDEFIIEGTNESLLYHGEYGIWKGSYSK